MKDNIIWLPTSNDPEEEMHGFYTPEEASRIARIPSRLISRWRTAGIVAPDLRWIDEDGDEDLGYTFEALVYLRLLRMFRENEVALGTSVVALRDLSRRFGPPSTKWEQAKIN